MRPRFKATAFACALAASFVALPAMAFASGDGGQSTGYIEVCKTFTSGSPAYAGTFSYKIADGSYMRTVSLQAVQGGPQVCTQPLEVPVGSASVTEQSGPWFQIASITGTQGDPGTVATTGTPGQALLQVLPAPAAGNTSLTTTVEYTNDPVTGVVEVCKQSAANSPALTGTYDFTITSMDPGVNSYNPATGAYDLPWSTTASATISAGGLGCSGPITVPAGSVQTVESGDIYVTAISATANGANMLSSSDLVMGTSVERVMAGNTTDQTIVTYTDALSTVKLCKEWSGDYAPTTVFPFTLTSSGPAGPTGVTPTVGLAAGQCQIVGTVRSGTQVNITEGITPGTKVAAIIVNPLTNGQGAGTVVPGTLSLPNRTVSVYAGAGETDITFVDQPADPGMLKICVNPTDNVTPGTVPFSVNGTQTIDVNLTNSSVQCTLDPTPFAFDSPVTISGGALVAPDSYSGGPSVVPTSVEVLYGGLPFATNQPSLTASTASSATVLMSEGMVTEVTFSVDPSAPSSGSTVAVSTTGASAAPVAPTTSPSLSEAPAAAPILETSALPAGRVSVSARTLRLERLLARVKASIRRLRHRLAPRYLRHLSYRLRRLDRRELRVLRRLEAKLARELAR